MVGVVAHVVIVAHDHWSRRLQKYWWLVFLAIVAHLGRRTGFWGLLSSYSWWLNKRDSARLLRDGSADFNGLCLCRVREVLEASFFVDIRELVLEVVKQSKLSRENMITK